VIGSAKELTDGRLLTVQEAADQLRISRWLVYNLIRANQLRTVKIGRRRLVTPAALAECIAMLEGGAASGERVT
jgi:excisionase family DNA binding protein